MKVFIMVCLLLAIISFAMGDIVKEGLEIVNDSPLLSSIAGDMLNSDLGQQYFPFGGK